jgi:hypothetical protein
MGYITIPPLAIRSSIFHQPVSQKFSSIIYKKKAKSTLIRHQVTMGGF